MENYYIQKLNSNKVTGKLFGLIPIPEGSLLKFILANLILSTTIEIFIGTYFISSLLGILISYEMYRKSILRLEILDYCLVDEIFMKEELDRHGVGEFTEDSPYVTDEDRDYIFLDSLILLRKNKFLDKIKNHHKFLSSMVIFYIFYFSFIFYLS